MIYWPWYGIILKIEVLELILLFTESKKDYFWACYGNLKTTRP